MAETIKNTEEKKDGIQTEQEKLESVKRADAAVKSMILQVRKYCTES